MSKGEKKAKGRGKDEGRGEGPLDRSPSHLLHRVLQLALDIYADSVGPDGPTQRQYAVLAAVARNEGLTQTGLVQATGIDRSTLADLVARMIAKGLLARERSAEDGRANAVRLTDQGRALLERATPNVRAADERILALLPKSKRDSFLKILASAAGKSEKKRDRDRAPDKAPKVEEAGDLKAAKVKKPKAKKTAKAARKTEAEAA
jgi:DNA-binding MarR family transcriptional regulator